MFAASRFSANRPLTCFSEGVWAKLCHAKFTARLRARLFEISRDLLWYWRWKRRPMT
jgi:hypothetical protein